MQHATTRFVILTLMALAGGCAPVTQSTAPDARPGEPVAATGGLRDRQPPAAAERFSVVSAASELRVLTFRDGPMARFGHNHVIRSTAISGSIWLADPISDSIVRIVLPVDSLSVDEQALRDEEGEGFESTPDEKARSGTRANMLGAALLNQAEHAFVRATCATDALADGQWPQQITCEVGIAGSDVSLTLPMALQIDDNQLIAEGEATVTHEQLGLTPFSAAGGAISVAEGMTLRYRIVGQKLSN